MFAQASSVVLVNEAAVPALLADGLAEKNGVMMFDNLFDQAMSDADDIILDTMGTEISIYPGGTERKSVPF